MTSATAADVARFMADKLNRNSYLDQETVVYEIKRQFGGEFVYTNANGNLAIARNVLKIFGELTPDSVWERSGRRWRKRAQFDEKGKRQQD